MGGDFWVRFLSYPMIRIELRGHVPSKASLYRVGRGGKGGMHLRDGAAAEIRSLRFQLNARWNRPALEHPEVTICFHLTNDRQDRDGALKTILDLLQISGVIKNDNIKYFNGWLHLAPAMITTEEKVIIELREALNGSAS